VRLTSKPLGSPEPEILWHAATRRIELGAPMHPEIREYNKARAPRDREICQLLAKEIEARYTATSQVNAGKLQRCLTEARDIQWDSARTSRPLGVSEPCGRLRLALSSCILNRWQIAAFPEWTEPNLESRISTTRRIGWSCSHFHSGRLEVVELPRLAIYEHDPATNSLLRVLEVTQLSQS
jgi:hypothetical protein